eukprot:16711-Heterococcus_DN1.PRE.1
MLLQRELHNGADTGALQRCRHRHLASDACKNQQLVTLIYCTLLLTVTVAVAHYNNKHSKLHTVLVSCAAHLYKLPCVVRVEDYALKEVVTPKEPDRCHHHSCKGSPLLE